MSLKKYTIILTVITIIFLFVSALLLINWYYINGISRTFMLLSYLSGMISGCLCGNIGFSLNILMRKED